MSPEEDISLPRESSLCVHDANNDSRDLDQCVSLIDFRYGRKTALISH